LENARAAGNRKRINELSKAYEESLAKLDEIENTEKALNTLINPREDQTKLKADAKWVDKAIAEVRDNGWNPIIDYGVRVNIEPLKELKLLHPAANRVK
jgi:vacuolar-type H+-ATPase subunit I/STV1